jgi:hypothetical protein
MLTVVEKGYWKPAPEVVEQLRQTQADLAPAVVAEQQAVAKRAQLQPAPAPVPAPAVSAEPASPAKTKPVVQGRVLEEKPRSASPSATAKARTPLMFVLGLAVFALVAFGWWQAGRIGFNAKDGV